MTPNFKAYEAFLFSRNAKRKSVAFTPADSTEDVTVASSDESENENLPYNNNNNNNEKNDEDCFEDTEEQVFMQNVKVHKGAILCLSNKYNILLKKNSLNNKRMKK